MVPFILFFVQKPFSLPCPPLSPHSCLQLREPPAYWVLVQLESWSRSHACRAVPSSPNRTWGYTDNTNYKKQTISIMKIVLKLWATTTRRGFDWEVLRGRFHIERKLVFILMWEVGKTSAKMHGTELSGPCTLSCTKHTSIKDTETQCKYVREKLSNKRQICQNGQNVSRRQQRMHHQVTVKWAKELKKELKQQKIME